MTIEIKVTNPAEHQPGELRAIALVLNTFAADLESGVIKHTPAFAAIGDRMIGTAVPAQVGQVAPLAPAADAAPSASVASPANSTANASNAGNTSDGELDSAGVRWDERIHSETKSKNKDNTWRIKRNTEQALIDAVLAEQKATAAGGAQGDDTPPDVPADTDQAPDVPNDEADTPPDVPAEETPAPAEDVKPAEVLRFITDNKIATEAACGILESLGVEGLKKPADLFVLAAKNPGLAAQALEAIKALV